MTSCQSNRNLLQEQKIEDRATLNRTESETDICESVTAALLYEEDKKKKFQHETTSRLNHSRTANLRFVCSVSLNSETEGMESSANDSDSDSKLYGYLLKNTHGLNILLIPCSCQLN